MAPCQSLSNRSEKVYVNKQNDNINKLIDGQMHLLDRLDRSIDLIPISISILMSLSEGRKEGDRQTDTPYYLWILYLGIYLFTEIYL